MSRPSFNTLPEAVCEVLASIQIGGTFDWLAANKVFFTPDGFPIHACMDLEQFYAGLQAAIDEAAPDFSIEVCPDEEAVRFMEFGKTASVQMYGSPFSPWQMMQAWRMHQQGKRMNGADGSPKSPSVVALHTVVGVGILGQLGCKAT